jgi:Orsellinic acid/F9775 biosynthesis cluster protein D
MDHSDSGSVLENRPLLRCEPKYGALVCLTCNNGFPRKRISLHLSRGHHFSVNIYRPMLEPFEQETLAEDWENLRRPSDELSPIEGLKSRTGYVCRGCGRRTVSMEIARQHFKCGQVDQVHLQRWNSQGAPAYWIVTPLPSKSKHVIAGDDSSTSPTGSFFL